MKVKVQPLKEGFLRRFFFGYISLTSTEPYMGLKAQNIILGIFEAWAPEVKFLRFCSIQYSRLKNLRFPLLYLTNQLTSHL